MDDPKDDIRRAVETAREASAPLDEGDDDVGLPPESPEADAPSADAAVVARCAQLDQSDTDNALRLIAHFGDDLVVVARDGDAGGDWLAWEGRYWDAQDGAAMALQAAQKIGERIALEVWHLGARPSEAEVIARASEFAARDKSAAAALARDAADEVKDRIAKRQAARWKFAVSSKNAARVNSALTMAAPHLRRSAHAFNLDPLLIVTRNATLRFVVEDDLECPDPDVRRKVARIVATRAFDRKDFATGIVPCDYESAATCPKWLRFLDETMDDLELRRTLQVYAATGLIGRLEQRLAYHYGSGANGKSVFLAVMMGVIGASLCVGLPKETIMGQGERGAGQASPDLVRLFGKRMVRIDELKDNEKLREDLVKRLTGGDPMIVRGLYSGYLEFANVATPHMSGNGQPQVDGTDEGIWRRLTVIHWARTIPEGKRRDFNELVADLLTERSGILNWLLDGVKDYLVNGLVIADKARCATEEYRADQDPVREFVHACLVKREGGKVQASALYKTYCDWSAANGRSAFHQTRFGREMKHHAQRREEGAARFYLDVALSDAALALHAPAASAEYPEERG